MTDEVDHGEHGVVHVSRAIELTIYGFSLALSGASDFLSRFARCILKQYDPATIRPMKHRTPAIDPPMIAPVGTRGLLPANGETGAAPVALGATLFGSDPTKTIREFQLRGTMYTKSKDTHMCL